MNRTTLKESKMEWISVKDRLPDIDNEYIVALDFLEVKSTTMNFMSMPSKWYTMSSIDVSKRVTHWMPLPEPPKEQ